jgi:ABC-type nitrate/sulfonate/bicarbonate transport system permease component
MAITFLEEKKKQRKFLLILVGLIILGILIFFWSFLSKPHSKPETIFPNFSVQRVEINWEVLKNAAIESLQSFEEITPSQEKVGRTNPFISY